MPEDLEARQTDRRTCKSNCLNLLMHLSSFSRGHQGVEHEALSPGHDWKGKQNLSLRNYMMCLGQSTVQCKLDMDGRTVKLSVFFSLCQRW